MANENLTQEQKDLIKKYESGKRTKPSDSFKDKKKMYQEQTDKNYKDGDRNWLPLEIIRI